MTVKNLLLIFIIIIIWAFQSWFLHRQTATNDLCQNYFAARFYFDHGSVYQNFPTHLCWLREYPLLFQTTAYPPTAILFFLPAGLSQLNIITLIWDIFVPLIFLLSLISLLSLSRHLTLPLTAFLFAVSSLWIGLLVSLSSRNVNPVLLILICLATINFHRRPGWSGFLIGIAGLLKIWPLALLIPGLIPKYRRSFLFPGLVSVFLGTILALIIFSPASFITYFTRVIPTERVFLPQTNNLSLLSFFTKIHSGLFSPGFPPPPPFTALFIGLLIPFTIITAGFYFLRLLVFVANRHSPQVFPVYIILFIPLLLLLFPLSWQYSQILLLLPLAGIIRYLRPLSRKFTQHSYVGLALGFLPLWLPHTPEILVRIFLLFPPLPVFSFLLYFILAVFSSLPLLINIVLTDKFSRA